MRALQFFLLTGLCILSTTTIGRCASSLDCGDYCERIETCRKGCSWVNGGPDLDSCLKNNCYATPPTGCPICPEEKKRQDEEAKKQQTNPGQYPAPTW